MCFNEPVRPDISFRGFRHRGKKQPHGWGLGFYPDGKAAEIIKEHLSAHKSTLADFLRNYPIRSRIFIGHVRCASRGDITYSNTHPFVRELNATEYIFAHNGTVETTFETRRFKRVGETDSENVFCWLMDNFYEKNIKEWKTADFDWLRNKLEEINKFGSLNCLLSDGEHLFCYADENGYNNGLFYTRRATPFRKVRLKDEDWEINLGEVKDPHQKGYIVATRALTDEEWQKFLPGELIVFRNGAVIYSSKREISETKEEFELRNEALVLEVLRSSPHRLSLKEINEKLNEKLSPDEVKHALSSLLAKKFIKQDSRDRVEWSNDSATFYTAPEKRKEIDRILKNLPC
jgi:glutamine amidotransferase